MSHDSLLNRGFQIASVYLKFEWYIELGIDAKIIFFLELCWMPVQKEHCVFAMHTTMKYLLLFFKNKKASCLLLLSYLADLWGCGPGWLKIRTGEPFLAELTAHVFAHIPSTHYQTCKLSVQDLIIFRSLSYSCLLSLFCTLHQLLYLMFVWSTKYDHELPSLVLGSSDGVYLVPLGTSFGI